MPLPKDTLLNAVEEMKKNSTKRKFKQAVELVMRLKEIDLKKQDSRINEAVQLPNPVGKAVKVCFIAAGDLAVRAKSAGADLILSRDDLDRLGREKKEARKIAREYDHFVSEAPLMPLVGKTLGATLGQEERCPHRSPHPLSWRMSWPDSGEPLDPCERPAGGPMSCRNGRYAYREDRSECGGRSQRN